MDVLTLWKTISQLGSESHKEVDKCADTHRIEVFDIDAENLEERGTTTAATTTKTKNKAKPSIIGTIPGEDLMLTP